jgi:hypothetical protein
MNYAKIKNTEVFVYPYTFEDLQKDNPYTNFGYSSDLYSLFKETEECTKNGYELVEVFEEPFPQKTNLQIATQETTPSFKEGVLTLGWALRNKTKQEIDDENIKFSQSRNDTV